MALSTVRIPRPRPAQPIVRLLRFFWTLPTGLRARLILAHELAHPRQHDVLGPFFLPAHVVAQLASALAYLCWRPRRGDPVHSHNPLEQRWLCLGFDAIFELTGGERLDEAERERLLRAFGVQFTSGAAHFGSGILPVPTVVPAVAIHCQLSMSVVVSSTPSPES